MGCQLRSTELDASSDGGPVNEQHACSGEGRQRAQLVTYQRLLSGLNALPGGPQAILRAETCPERRDDQAISGSAFERARVERKTAEREHLLDAQVKDAEQE